MTDYMTPALAQWKRWVEGPLLLLAVGSLPILVLELAAHDELSDADNRGLFVFNVVLLVAFAVDFVVGLALATRRGSYVRSQWLNLVVIAAQGIAVLPRGHAGVSVLRGLRGLRAIRPVMLVVRLVAITGAAARESRQELRRNALGYAIGIAIVTWLSSAVAFALLEDLGEEGRENLESFGDALWWAATTMSTVGYGDVAPQTVAGRSVAVVTMVLGISVFATVTAKIAEFLVRGDLEEGQRPTTSQP